MPALSGSKKIKTKSNNRASSGQILVQQKGGVFMLLQPTKPEKKCFQILLSPKKAMFNI